MSPFAMPLSGGALASPREKRTGRRGLVPIERLARSHLLLQERPHIRACGAALIEALAIHFTNELALPVQISLRSLEVTRFDLPTLGGWVASLALRDGAIAWLDIDPLLLGIILHNVAGADEPIPIPSSLTRLEEAALALVLLEAIGVARADSWVAASIAPRLVALRAAAEDLRPLMPCLTIRVSVMAAGIHGEARLLLSEGWFTKCLSAGAPQTPGRRISESTARLLAIPRLAAGALSRSQCASLEAGDVVFLQASRSQGAMAGIGCLAFSLFSVQGTFLVNGGFSVTAMKDAVRSTLGAIAHAELEVELACVRLALRDLQALEVGSVIPLQVPASPVVLLRIDGAPFARAELVEVDGSLAARLVEMV